MQDFATTPLDVLCTSCNIDGFVKMPLQASIFTHGIIISEIEFGGNYYEKNLKKRKI